MELSASKNMCFYCFETLDMRLKGNFTDSPPMPADLQTYVSSDVKAPMFITFQKKRKGYESYPFSDHDNLELRGCIGTLRPVPIVQMRDFVVKSALQDRRFNPVRPEELPLLHVTVSLLHKFEPAPGGAYDWEIGTHGIILSFDDQQTGENFSATYLPEVALEHGMTHESAIQSLARKAGYRGQITPKLLAQMQVERYQSTRISMGADEWQRLRSGNYVTSKTYTTIEQRAHVETDVSTPEEVLGM
eukprot:GDKI01018492.1.p1 GENE.GDKI01018492.1~~GDKI01018492.1.p1  ORF type:complete len:246 (-),score=65.67 GDKI01018492.1:752-1489(-)